MTEDSPGAPSLCRDRSGTPDARESDGTSTILGLDLGEFKVAACPQGPATSEVRSTTIHSGPADLRNDPVAASPGSVHSEACTVEGQVADTFAELAFPDASSNRCPRRGAGASSWGTPREGRETPREVLETCATAPQIMPATFPSESKVGDGAQTDRRRKRRAGHGPADRTPAARPTRLPRGRTGWRAPPRSANESRSLLISDGGNGSWSGWRSGSTGPALYRRGQDIPELSKPGPDGGLVLGPEHQQPLARQVTDLAELAVAGEQQGRLRVRIRSAGRPRGRAADRPAPPGRPAAPGPSGARGRDPSAPRNSSSSARPSPDISSGLRPHELRDGLTPCRVWVSTIPSPPAARPPL